MPSRTDLVPGEGEIRYELHGRLHRLTVEADPAISEYYRSLVPRHVRLNRQKHPPHVSVVREEMATPPAWGLHQGLKISFLYLPIVRTGETYFWLKVHDDRFSDLRVELGLPRTCWYTAPPDGSDCFHLTLGNLKSL